MRHTMIRTWWLLALCGILEAVYSALNLFMMNPDGTLEMRTFAVRVTVVFLGRFALAAGICAVAAGLWSLGRNGSWLLVLNGLALSAYGLISVFWRHGRLQFLPIALLFVVMAASIAALMWGSMPRLRRHAVDKWFVALAGAVAVCFAVGFIVSGFGWVRFDQPGSYFLWMSLYFGFSAICMLALGLRLNSIRAAGHRMAH